MTDYNKAFDKIIPQYEGLYDNDPDDSGGETYRGIARSKHPEWQGWRLVDSYKSSSRFPKILEKDISLQNRVREFYKPEFWDKFKGDMLTQEIAEEMFDQSINFGVVPAVRHFQRALNILNNKKKLYPDTLIDGIFGNETLQLYGICALKRGPRVLFNVLNCYQGMRYINLMEHDEVKEKYIGWFGRIEISR